MTDVIKKFVYVYTHLNRSNLDLLDTLYDDNVDFIDPFGKIHGIESLRSHFSDLYRNVLSCEFQFGQAYVKSNSAMMIWQMRLRHRTLARKVPIEVAGSSQIRFNHKVYFHRDYFDAGQMLYQNLPVVGSVIKFINKQVQP